MRNFLFFFISALMLYTVYSFSYRKTTEITTGVALYHFFHIPDTTNTGRIWEEDFQMAFDRQRSLYTSYTKKIQDSVQKARIEAASNSGSNMINMGVFLPYTADNIYTSENENTVYINKSFSGNNYLIKEDLEKINWKIEKETQKLLGFTCQKATGVCKGRTYTAWFTTDVPAGFGPWKLQGLPGLILEAYTRDQRIKFTCTKVTLDGILPNNLSLAIPKDAIATTYTEYNRMEKAYRESLNIDGYGNGEITIDKVTENNKAIPSTRRPVLNNPLELKK